MNMFFVLSFVFLTFSLTQRSTLNFNRLKIESKHWDNGCSPHTESSRTLCVGCGSQRIQIKFKFKLIGYILKTNLGVNLKAHVLWRAEHERKQCLDKVCTVTTPQIITNTVQICPRLAVLLTARAESVFNWSLILQWLGNKFKNIKLILKFSFFH